LENSQWVSPEWNARFKTKLTDTQLWQVSQLLAHANEISDPVKRALVSRRHTAGIDTWVPGGGTEFENVMVGIKNGAQARFLYATGCADVKFKPALADVWIEPRNDP
jgi:hypothetical protein